MQEKLEKTFACTNEVLSSMYNIYLSFFLKLFFSFFLLSTNTTVWICEKNLRDENVHCTGHKISFYYFFKTVSDPTLFQKVKISKKVSDHNNQNTCNIKKNVKPYKCRIIICIPDSCDPHDQTQLDKNKMDRAMFSTHLFQKWFFRFCSIVH